MYCLACLYEMLNNWVGHNTGSISIRSNKTTEVQISAAKRWRVTPYCPCKQCMHNHQPWGPRAAHITHGALRGDACAALCGSTEHRAATAAAHTVRAAPTTQPPIARAVCTASHVNPAAALWQKTMQRQSTPACAVHQKAHYSANGGCKQDSVYDQCNDFSCVPFTYAR
jgi:DUF1365 family protein